MRAMSERISRRIGAITESATLAVDAKAKALQAAGEPVIGFGAGEPDFPTPSHIVEAAVIACRDPKRHHYSPAAGLPELREAIAAKTARDSGYAASAANVVVTNGGKQAVYNTFEALLNPGDEVLLPAPYWTTYPEPIALAGATPVVIATDVASGFKVTVEQLEAAYTPRTKALLFVSPSNPTGAVYSREQTLEIGRWAASKGIWVITDEIYEHLVYDGREFSSMATLVPELGDRVVVLNGVAKTYAMTGWRVGWMIGPSDLIKAATNLQSHCVQRVQRRAGRRARRGDRRSHRGRRDACRVRSAAPAHARVAVGHRGCGLPRARGRVLRVPFVRRRARSHVRRSQGDEHQRVGHDPARRSQGGRGARRSVRRAGLLPAVVRAR